MSGGAAIPVELIRAFEEKFGCAILEGYGLSETSPVASFNHPDRARKAGLDRHPDRGRRDAGLGRRRQRGAAGRGRRDRDPRPQRDEGLLGAPEATEEAIDADGWFRTGDMAKVDEDGYFFIVDRKKDLIIRGGYNVYPREVEEVLYEHPAVQEAAVVGVPDDALGEEVGAAVVLKQGRVARRRRAEGLRQGAGRRLQVPAQGLVRGRAAEGPDRQDPQARDRGAENKHKRRGGEKNTLNRKGKRGGGT